MKEFVLTLMLMSGCSVIPQVPSNLPGIPPDSDPSIAIASADGGGGHGCPVEGVVLTARHVVERGGPAGFRMVQFSWSQGEGGIVDGEGGIYRTSLTYDLAILQLDGEVESIKYLPRGRVSRGDWVVWYEYDFRTGPNSLRARRRVARVLRIVANHLVIDQGPVPGASGSCLINTKGQAVGVVLATITNEDTQETGWAVLLPDYIPNPKDVQ